MALRSASRSTAFAATLAIAAAALLATPAAAQTLNAKMTGAAEKPAAADPDGAGTAKVTINADKGEVCYELSVSGIAPATMAHIHKAPTDAAGPVAVPLVKPDDAGKSKGCATVDKAVAAAIAASPGDYYVNVHNAEFPAGAVRGQLGK